MIFYIVELDELVEIDLGTFIWKHHGGGLINRYIHLYNDYMKAKFPTYDSIFNYTAVYIGDI